MCKFSRTKALVGEEALKKLSNSHVLLFGVGGVGSFTAEALVRSGIGEITIVDYDIVDITNINRQLIALHSTIGLKKVDALRDRLLDINPELKIHAIDKKLDDKTLNSFFDVDYDYVIDAIDMVSSKLGLIKFCYNNGIKIISCMGTGNKLDPSKLVVTDIFKTSNCPLARVIRSELRKANVKGLKVVYSEEKPKPIKDYENKSDDKKRIVSSSSFVPSSAGLLIASEVVRNIIEV